MEILKELKSEDISQKLLKKINSKGNFNISIMEVCGTHTNVILKNALKDDASVKVIIQNLINKIWFRTDDTYTIEEVQKQIGKEEKEKI